MPVDEHAPRRGAHVLWLHADILVYQSTKTEFTARQVIVQSRPRVCGRCRFFDIGHLTDSVQEGTALAAGRLVRELPFTCLAQMRRHLPPWTSLAQSATGCIHAEALA